MAPSRYDWKIVDWDVKPQHNQPTFGAEIGPSPNARKFFFFPKITIFLTNTMLLN